ncbi:MAG: hypothetical protein EXR11_14250 [Rhodospirillaceae bacterium]|nr:hypothetical protein [Rhodospirillaceae bacterium]
MSIYKFFSATLPSDHAGIAKYGFEEIEALPNLQNWKPATSDHDEASRLLSIGVPLYLVSGQSSFDPIRRNLSDALRKNVRPILDEISELRCAGIVRALGAISVDKISRSNEVRKPDLKVYCANNTSFEIEVVTPAAKPEYKSARSWLDKLVAEVFAFKIPFDLRLGVVEILRDDERLALLEAARTVSPNESHSSRGRWIVSAEEINRSIGEVWVTGKDYIPRPNWWPSHLSQIFRVSMMADTSDQQRSNPSVIGAIGYPTLRYMNPILRKADRPQGDATLPYIIAADIENIPNALHYFREELPKWFHSWDHVSGVLGFHHFMEGVSKYIVRCQFFSNPNSTISPPELLQERQEEFGCSSWELTTQLRHYADDAA